MFDTVSLFDSMEQDDTQRRVASRRALALAHHRIESSLGRFLRGARDEDEFFERLALCQEDFAGYITTAAVESGCDTPEHIAAALRDHYKLAAQPVEFIKTPEEEEKEDEEEEGKTSRTASGRRWTPRVAGPNAMQGPSQMGTGRGGEQYPIPPGDEHHHRCPQCGSMNHASDPKTGNPMCLDCGYSGPPANPYMGGKQSAPLAPTHPNPALQQDTSSQHVTCPECGGSNPQCPKCHGTGRVNNFGPSVLDAVAKGYGGYPEYGYPGPGPATPGEPGAKRFMGSRTAEEQNNTGLEGPEPKMDKGEFKHQKPEVPGKIKEKDMIVPIGPPKNVRHDELEEIGDVEKVDLPAGDINLDDSGFAPAKVGPAPHTKTFPKGDQADPVTRESLSSVNPLIDMLSDEWPSDAVVETAFQRY